MESFQFCYWPVGDPGLRLPGRRASSRGSRWPEAREGKPPEVGWSRAPGGGAAPGDSAGGGARRKSARLEASPARSPLEPCRWCQRSRPAERGVRARQAERSPGKRREARPRQRRARGFPAGHRTLAQTAGARAAVSPPARPAASAGMGTVPAPGPAHALAGPFQPHEPTRDPGSVSLTLLGGRGPGEVSSAPLNLSPICLAGAR